MRRAYECAALGNEIWNKDFSFIVNSLKRPFLSAEYPTVYVSTVRSLYSFTFVLSFNNSSPAMTRLRFQNDMHSRTIVRRPLALGRYFIIIF